jgi:hypothetical protein
VASEIQRIPPAPRRVAWRKVVGYRWPLAAVAFVLAAYCGVLIWMLFLANSGAIEDRVRLEAGKNKPIVAVVRTAAPAVTAEHPEPQHVVYDFFADGQAFEGEGDVQGGNYTQGQAINVEYVAGTPSLNRIAGGRSADPTRWLETMFALVVVPGLLIGLGYAAGVLHLRRVLAHGDVGQAQITLVRRVPFCLPESFAVHYVFRDHHAKERTGRHWVRAHSALGQRLLTMMRHGTYDRVPVLHDRIAPQHSRLVLPDDFSPDKHPIDPAATIRL